MNHDVDMRGSAGVVAGEDGLELRDAIRVGALNSAKPGVVDVCVVGAVTVAACDDARIDTRGVAVPHLEVDVGDWVAGLNVNDLVVEDNAEALLFFNNVLADVFSCDI